MGSLINKIDRYIDAIEPIVFGFDAQGCPISIFVEDGVLFSRFCNKNFMFRYSLAYLLILLLKVRFKYCLLMKKNHLKNFLLFVDLSVKQIFLINISQ